MISKKKITYLTSENDIELIKVDPENNKHCKILYEFLKKREFKISHKKLPVFSTHKNFIKKNRYRKWFLIVHKNNFIGSIYILYDNGIGIDVESVNYHLIDNILKIIFMNINPLKAIPSIRIDKFHININPTNNSFKEIIEKLGATLQQQTFIFNR